MYSFLLTLACAAASLAAAAAVATRWRALEDRLGWARRTVRLAALTSLTLLALSAAVHVAWDHRPGSGRGLKPIAFLREHPALPTVAGIAVLALTARPPRR